MVSEISNLNIVLLDINEEMVNAWKSIFGDKVTIVNSSLDSFFKANDVKAIVSPANSFGEMTGGFDRAISDCIGWGAQYMVREAILAKHYGEQPVGSSICVEVAKDLKIIHTPTMRKPSRIIDPSIIYTCMRSTLVCAMRNLNNGDTIIIPAFGGRCGMVDYFEIARQMFKAYESILYYPQTIECMHYNYISGD